MQKPNTVIQLLVDTLRHLQKPSRVIVVRNPALLPIEASETQITFQLLLEDIPIESQKAPTSHLTGKEGSLKDYLNKSQGSRVEIPFQVTLRKDQGGLHLIVRAPYNWQLLECPIEYPDTLSIELVAIRMGYEIADSFRVSGALPIVNALEKRYGSWMHLLIADATTLANILEDTLATCLCRRNKTRAQLNSPTRTPSELNEASD